MSSNSDSYKQAIDILMAGNFDSRFIAVELAKNYPTIFVRLANGSEKPEPWMASVRAKVADGMKVEAIKEIRANTGIGLKEAKDIADNVQNLLIPTNPQLTYYTGAAAIREPQHVKWLNGIAGRS